MRFQNRRTTVEALVVPNKTNILLGAISMEGIDLLIEPKQQTLVLNPKSPGKARAFGYCLNPNQINTEFP